MVVMIVHDKWEKSGRTFLGETPGQKVYKAHIAQKNVDLGQGTYAPYVWDAQTKILQFAEYELRLVSAGLELWVGGEKVSSGRFQPEVFDGTWNQKIAVVSGLTVNETQTETSTDEIDISYKVTTEDQESTIRIKGKAYDWIEFGVDVKALKAGTQRLMWENDISTKGEKILASSIKGGVPDTTVGYKTDTAKWRWKQWEAPDHNVDDTETGKLKISLNEKEYELGEIKSLHPATWGPTSIANTNDDACEHQDGGPTIDLNGLDADGLVVGDLAGAREDEDPCWRWDNVLVSGTAENGCKITVDVTYLQNSGGQAVAVPLYGIEEADPADWNSGTRPSQRSKTTANVSVPYPGGTGSYDTPEIKTVIQELIDDVHSSGNAMAFVGQSISSDGGWQFEDFETGGTVSSITIVYTAAGGVANPWYQYAQEQ